MAKHYNLYHLLLEDQQRNPMDPDARDQVQKNIEEFYKKIKPPWEAKPLISITGQDTP